MPTEMKRLTFMVTPEMETALRTAKKDRYFDKSNSEMIRDLIVAGLKAAKEEQSACAQEWNRQERNTPR